MRPKPLAVLLALCTLAAVTAAPSRAAAPLTRVPCQVLGASPAFATDHLLFCASGASAEVKNKGPVVLYRSSDFGHTWGAPTVVSSGSGVDQAVSLAFSPAFATDHSMFVSTMTTGWFESTDGGKSFGVFAPNASTNAPGPAEPFLDGDKQAGVTKAGLVVLDGTGGTGSVYGPVAGEGVPIVTPPLLSPISVTVSADFANDHKAVLMVGGGPAVGSVPYDRVPRAYACDVHFVCSREIYNFGAGNPNEQPTVRSFPLSGLPGNYFARRRASGTTHTITLFRSRDGGQTWAPWTSTDALFKGSHRGDTVVLAASPTTPKQLFLRLSSDQNGDDITVPSEQLFRSDDDGATWTRLGFAWPGYQADHRPRSTLPWNAQPWDIPYTSDAPALVVGPHGQLFTLGRREGVKDPYQGLYCSKNYGRTWSNRC